jgi:hypothetical protein
VASLRTTSAEAASTDTSAVRRCGVTKERLDGEGLAERISDPEKVTLCYLRLALGHSPGIEQHTRREPTK